MYHFQELWDEHAASLPTRLINKFFDTWEIIKDNLGKDEVLPVISLIAAISFVVIGAQCMQLLVGLDDDEQSGELYKEVFRLAIWSTFGIAREQREL